MIGIRKIAKGGFKLISNNTLLGRTNQKVWFDGRMPR